MSLPLPWVEKIFQKLSLVYGRDFLGRWEGIPIEDVKSDWAHELSGYQQSPDAISYALQHLPNKPPTVLEFRTICQAAPRVVKATMIEKSPGTYTPEVARKALAEARALLTRAKA